MGDGCVACVPSQQIMEQFSMCGGNNKTTTNSNSNTTPDVNKTVKMKPKTKIKRRKTKAKAPTAKKDSRNPHTCTSNNITNNSSVSDIDYRPLSAAATNKDEVEEGELGTMDVDNQGPFPRKLELKSEIEKGEFVPPWKWRKREEAEKSDFYCRGSTKDKFGKGEFVPDRERCRRSEDEHGVFRTRMHTTVKDKGLKGDCDQTPPYSAKYSTDKDLNRSGNQHAKRPSRHECTSTHDKTHKLSSKIVHEDGSLKTELSNGKNNGIEYLSGKKLKRPGVDSEINARKIGGEYDEYAGSKSRKLSDGDGHSVFYTEKYSRSLTDRIFRHSSSSFPNGSSDRYSSSNYKSSMSSRNFYDKRNGSPRHLERSPHDRPRYHEHRDWSPALRDKSPYDRGHHWSPSRRDRSQSPYSRGRFYDPCRSPYSRGRYYDHKNQSPSYPDHSPHDGDSYHDRRDGTPNFLEQSPLDWSRPLETIRKSGTTDKQLDYQKGKGQEEKPNQTDLSGKESKYLGKESKARSSLDNRDGSTNRIRKDQLEKGEAYEDTNVNTKESSPDNGVEDMASMEEDMDICNTPPHVPVVADASTGKWYYVDHFGVECGPSKLCELKTLVDEGYLFSDHFIKHIECERWVTVENAVSPAVNTNFPSIVPDSVTKLVSPPEVSGNVLADNGDHVQSSYETPATPCKSALSSMGSCKRLQTVEDLRIDERVGAFLEGVTVFPGKELETVREVLQLNFEYDVLEKFGNNEGDCCQSMSTGLSSRVEDDADSGSTLLESSDKDSHVVIADTYGVFSGLWSCKGGDWRRNDDVALDRSSRKKLVLNDGFPLCQMPKSGYEDPRWQRKEELYYPLPNRKLELPAWAFTPADEWNDRSNESKPVGPRGGKGTMLPVVRINVCVVKDHGSFGSDARMKVKGKERYSSKASHSLSSADDTKISSDDGVSCLKHMHGQDSLGLSKRNISIPKDHVYTANELQLHLGDWFYLDGSGHEHGPLTLIELQALAGQGAIHRSSSIFRKVDRIWVPLSCSAEDSETAVWGANESKTTLSNTNASRSEGNGVSSIFHYLHPQFIGYTRGKLHEFVMKSYKSREFAAAINEFLDPWINARQPKKEMENSPFFQKSGQYRATKRAKLNDSEGDFDLEDEFFRVKDECSFDELCGDETFDKEYYSQSELAGESWGSLDGHVLARIFHFLRADIRSLVKVSLTCKSWRSAVRFYKSICLQVDLCSVANSCNDSTICGLLNDYNKEKLRTLLVRGCFNVSSGVLEEVLRLFPQVSIIDIRSCSQLDDLTSRYPHINWVSSHSKIKSLKQIDDATSSALSICSVNTQMDDFSGLRNYLESSEKRESANQLFHRSLYKRSKLFDAKKSSTILSRDAHLRRLAMRKYDHGYKKMAEFLASSLKGIMKQNSFEYFVPKVARIEGRIRNGYYAGRGLSSIKEDIRRMCRDAIKLNNRGNASDMNRIISLFIRLATSLDGASVPWKDDSPPGFSSASSKYKKVFSKGTDKKFTNRSNRFITNGISDFGEHASDREIRRRLSKLNRKPVDSGSETSEDFDRSSDKYTSDSESTASDTESDSEARTGSGLVESNGDVYSPLDDGLDSLADEREWGARMTEASLVPPVTRKYEVIDHYVIVADEGEVKRKMQVSLPDNYADKLIAQRNGTEESDMEIPEVKDYKPRKQLGDEVIEQEVYGIDPYTHNLLLDSMPEDSDWSLLDKHTFIEDVVLRTLNKQVRHFTGSGSVPMTYSLKPVFDEIEETAVEENDWRTIRLCQYILKAIDTRLEDKYVAYRKGLGVVCNKKGGFSEEDFVVEFLGEVYPAWKWFEKQAPEFYNIHLERPKGDADGYDLVVVDAMHKANYASRICHSCRPNCEAK
ncbi:hypothetical protein Leryth_015521 [Lithospermum erythrorhizon]|nr:hypothetical protein Leryth_015521 [Lithospermum erythrorhizon]